MKKKVLFVGALACSFVSTTLFAQEEKKEKVEFLEEVVVTATKFETNTKNVGKIIYTITQETIKNNAGKTISDLLNEIPGVEINGKFSTK